jgi:ribonuclease PH
MRPDGRRPDELRPITIEPGAVAYAEGSALIAFGDTRVLCAATVEERVPPYRKGTGAGWVTAEYAMLPRSTQVRTERDGRRGRVDGRASEIQRLIGRSLRAAVDMEAIGERTIIIDCDVLQADGGTRTASITGGWVALHDCLTWMKNREIIRTVPLRDHVAAISCGIHGGTPVLDLDYAEDSAADTDANFVLTGNGGIVEIQGTAEKTPFTEAQFMDMLMLARKGVGKLIDLQKLAVM